jgi:HK97 family phage prohead protease/HK97 family phage major capsid protein
MTDLLQMVLPLEVRNAVQDTEGDGRTLEGRIVPYGETITLGDSQEAFAPGVFSEVEPGDVVLLWQHDTTAPIGRMTILREEEDGAYGTFRLADTERAREARSLISEGVIRGLSVGFQPDQTQNQKGVRTHVKARLRETSLVTFPAYPTAGVLAVREEERMDEPEVMVDEAIPEPPTVDLTPIETRLDEQSVALREVRNQIANIQTPGAPPEPTITLGEAYAQLLKMVLKDRQERALADVIGTGTGNAEGLVYNQFVSELLGYMDVRRPLFSAAGTVGFPSSGYGLVFPRITQHVLVSKRTGEKTEAASRELTVAQATYSAEWFAGAVDVSIELIEQSEPSVLEVVGRDLLGMYAVATETEFAVDVAAAATATGDTLTFTTWGDFVADVVSASAAIQTATGAPGDRLALTSASWLNMMVLLNPSQPATSFNTAPDFTAESVNVGGVIAFHAPTITVDTQFNTTSLRKAEKPPVQVSATNVALMGRDIGIIGATIALPLYPAGILKHAV